MDLWTPIGLAPLEILILAPHDLAYMQRWPQLKTLNLTLMDLWTPIGFAPLEILISAPCDLAYMQRWPQLKSAMYEIQSAIWCMNRSIILILTHKSHFTNLPLTFLFINNLTKHYKFNTMRLVMLTWFSDFVQVLYSARKHHTKS
jgi:hypothetical protein